MTGPIVLAIVGLLLTVARLILRRRTTVPGLSDATHPQFWPPLDVTPGQAAILHPSVDARKGLLGDIIAVALHGSWVLGHQPRDLALSELSSNQRRRLPADLPDIETVWFVERTDLDRPKDALNQALFQAVFFEHLDSNRCYFLPDWTLMDKLGTAYHVTTESLTVAGFVDAKPVLTKPDRMTLLAAQVLTALGLILALTGDTPAISFAWFGAAVSTTIATLVKWPPRFVRPSGHEVIEQITNIQDYLTLSREERLEILNTIDATPMNSREIVAFHEQLLPYAVMFDLVTEWSHELALDYAAANLEPTWYRSSSDETTGFNAENFARCFPDLMNSQTFSELAARPLDAKKYQRPSFM